MSMQNSLWDFLGTPDLDHGEKYPEEPCVHTLTRQEFFTSGAEGVYLFIKYCRSSFDDDGKIMAKKFAYFPVIATEDSNGYIDALWAWPVDMVFRLDGETFLPKVGDEFSYYPWVGFEKEADSMNYRKIVSVNLFAAQQEDKVNVFVKITTEPFKLR